MSTKRVDASAGWHWIGRAVRLAAGHPKVVLGGAALLPLGASASMLLAGAGPELLVPGPVADAAASFAACLLLVAPALLVTACLTVGYLRLVHAVANGRRASPAGVFAGFGDMRAPLRVIAFTLLVAAIMAAVPVGLLALSVPLALVAQVMPFPPDADGGTRMLLLVAGFGTVLLLAWLAGSIVGFAVLSIGIGQIALAGRGVSAAIGDGLAGALRNLPALPVLLVVGLAAAIATGLALLLAAVPLSEPAGGWSTVVPGMVLYCAFMATACAITGGVMYQLWRDACGEPDTTVPVTAGIGAGS